jgi:precorrin-6B methylase 2
VDLALWKRKVDLAKFILFSKEYRYDLKLRINLEYRRALAARNGVHEIEMEKLLDWDNLDLKLSRPTSADGQTSKLELLILTGFAKSLKPGQNFLEIGTYNGNTAFNCALNLPEGSKIITIDLPENSEGQSDLKYDNYLIKNPNRQQKKCAGMPNVQQVYADSTKLDFSQFDYNVAFIDGGHDYETVKSDSLNVLKTIKKPGVVLWHDYDVECPVGDLIHELAREYPIFHIKGTRTCVARVEK